MSNQSIEESFQRIIELGEYKAISPQIIPTLTIVKAITFIPRKGMKENASIFK